MEHKIILGGEIYLPFARSRIKAMRATGLEYASQQFEMGDASVKVRIMPGHEYITLSGGSVTMKMDSGMLGITGGIGGLSIWRYDPGYLIECGPTVAYNAAFLKNSEAPWTKVNPSKDNALQFAGDVSISGTTVKGVFREDLDMTAQPRMNNRPAAASLSPAWEAVPNLTVPEQRVQAEDGVLINKKVMTIFCPASIFTGRCRLYIQAIYGLPLYEYANEYKPGGVRGKVTTNSPIAEIVSGTSAAPLLRINSYVAKDDFKPDIDGNLTKELNEYPAVAVDTNSGVMLDASGNHWLIQLNNGNIRVFPLISDKNGESLRKHLRARTDSTYKFSEVAREHLETYILARCLPDAKNVMKLDTKYTCGSFSMGYGWHWSWGESNLLTADIVVNDTVSAIEGQPNSAKMRSSHFRLNVSIEYKPVPQGGWKKSDKDRQTFSAIFTTVEGLKEWNVLRAFWCIAEPNYISGMLTKTTPKLTALFPCDAPFYAFYTRNELKVCRVIVTPRLPVKSTRSKTPGYAIGDVPNNGDITTNTIGDRSGFVKDIYDTAPHFAAVFSVGKDATPALVLGVVANGLTIETTNKVRLDEGGPAFAGDGFNAYNYVSVGDPDDRGVYPLIGPIAGYAARGYYLHWTWDHASFATSDEYTSHACIVVPFFDSECIYMQSQDIATKTKYEHVKKTSTSTGAFAINWITRSYITSGTGALLGPYDRNEYNPSFALADAVNVTVPVSVKKTNDTITKIYCKAGSLPCVWSETSDFFNNDFDDVGAQFYTLSGTSVASPTVYSGSQQVNKGVIFKSGKDLPVTLVGWV